MRNARNKKSPFFNGYRSCGMPSDVLEFTSNATHMQQVCNKDIDMYRTFFSRNTGECPFLRVSTSGAFAGEYWMGVLALTDTYSTANIARQRDMSKIALQSANGIDCFLNLIKRIYKLLYIKEGIHFFGECHCT